MKYKDIEISFLKGTGEVRFTRGDKVYNAASKEILYKLVDEKTKKELEHFFSGSEEIEVIFGDGILCG